MQLSSIPTTDKMGFNILVSKEPLNQVLSFPDYLQQMEVDGTPIDINALEKDKGGAYAQAVFKDYNAQALKGGMRADSVNQALNQEGEIERVRSVGTKIEPIGKARTSYLIQSNRGIFAGTPLENIIPEYTRGQQLAVNYLGGAPDELQEDNTENKIKLKDENKEINDINKIDKDEYNEPSRSISQQTPTTPIPYSILPSSIQSKISKSYYNINPTSSSTSINKSNINPSSISSFSNTPISTTLSNISSNQPMSITPSHSPSISSPSTSPSISSPSTSPSISSPSTSPSISSPSTSPSSPPKSPSTSPTSPY